MIEGKGRRYLDKMLAPQIQARHTVILVMRQTVASCKDSGITSFGLTTGEGGQSEQSGPRKWRGGKKKRERGRSEVGGDKRKTEFTFA